MSLIHSNVEYRAGSLDCEGLIVRDSERAGQRGLVVFPNALGITKPSLETADDIAARGYVVLVADMYGKGVRPTTIEEASPIARALRADRRTWRERVTAAFEVLRAEPAVDPRKLGAMGFCFGGSCALELARSGAEVRGVAALHGGLATATPEEARAIRGSVFVLHGADDPFVPPAEVRAFEEEMRNAGVDWQLIEFGGAVHSFADRSASIPGKAVYDAKVTRRAFRMVDDFFAEVCA